MDEEKLYWIKKLLRNEVDDTDVMQQLVIEKDSELQDLIDAFVEEYGYPVTAKDIEKTLVTQKEDYRRLVWLRHNKRPRPEAVVDADVKFSNKSQAAQGAPIHDAYGSNDRISVVDESGINNMMYR